MYAVNSRRGLSTAAGNITIKKGLSCQLADCVTEDKVCANLCNNQQPLRWLATNEFEKGSSRGSKQEGVKGRVCATLADVLVVAWAARLQSVANNGRSSHEMPNRNMYRTGQFKVYVTCTDDLD